MAKTLQEMLAERTLSSKVLAIKNPNTDGVRVFCQLVPRIAGG